MLREIITVGKNSLKIVCFIWVLFSMLTERDSRVYQFFFSKEPSGIIFMVLLITAAIVVAAFHKWEMFPPILFLLLIYIGIVWTPFPASKLLTDLYWAVIPVTILFVFTFFESK